MKGFVHRSTIVESYMTWQCVPRKNGSDLFVSLAPVGGMSVVMPLPANGMPFTDWVILVDRIERLFWSMHGASLSDPA